MGPKLLPPFGARLLPASPQSCNFSALQFCSSCGVGVEFTAVGSYSRGEGETRECDVVRCALAQCSWGRTNGCLTRTCGSNKEKGSRGQPSTDTRYNALRVWKGIVVR